MSPCRVICISRVTWQVVCQLSSECIAEASELAINSYKLQVEASQRAVLSQMLRECLPPVLKQRLKQNRAET
eukprot:127937-Pleurochrysis_carterae.AAC.1